MRLAYSFAGEGFGHAMRTTVIGPLLARKHDVVYFVPDAVRDFVVARLGEGPYERIPHFAFVKKGERVRLFASILSTIPLLFRFPFEMARLVDRLRCLGIDAVISDFDPFLSWAARIAGVPILQINHPGIVQRLLRPHPLSLVTALATRILEGPWNERMLVSFYDGDVGPIIRKEIFTRPVRDDGILLVNLKNSLRPVVLPVLDAMGLRYRLMPDPRANFEEAFAACSFVLSTAGHQIIAESIALNKPILVIPQRGQWEQQLNAEMVEKTGKGRSTTIERLSTDLADFALHLERFRSNRVPARFTVADDRRSILRKIEGFLLRYRRNTARYGVRRMAQPSGPACPVTLPFTRVPQKLPLAKTS